MTTTLRRLPGFAIAVIALALSASLTFAEEPAGSVAGLANAASHAGVAVPVRSAGDGVSSDETAETDEATESESDSVDNCNVDLTQDPSVLATLSHGSVVCTAAHMDTPEGYANHGAWVSHWAKMGHAGADASTKHGNGSR